MRARLVALALIAACAAGSPALAETAEGPCPSRATAQTLAPGLVLERHKPSAPAPMAKPEPCLWLLRIDPERFLPELASTSLADARTPEAWLRARGWAAVINAAMYLPSGKPTGMAIADGDVLRGGDNARYGGFLAFGPRRKGLPAIAHGGRGCPGFSVDRLRRDYRSVIQNYRLLDCKGAPVSWKDPQVHSAAAVAVDRKGWLVFAHITAPYPMAEVSRMLADPSLGLRFAMFVEGGTPAQMSIRHGDTVVDRIGAYEAFMIKRGGVPDPLPLVLGVRDRRAAKSFQRPAKPAISKP